MGARQYGSGPGKPGSSGGGGVPGDLRRAIDADDAARAAFDELPPSHRRAYVDWVEEAKGAPERARRIAGTVERLREGEPADVAGDEPEREVEGTAAGQVEGEVEGEAEGEPGD
jgi:hypothetical protein